MSLDRHMAALAARTAAAWRAEHSPDALPVTDDSILIGPGGQTLAVISLTAATAHDLIDHLRAARPELVHFAGAAHRDPMALEVCREYQRDPTASEDDLRARARATVYGWPGDEARCMPEPRCSECDVVLDADEQHSGRTCNRCSLGRGGTYSTVGIPGAPVTDEQIEAHRRAVLADPATTSREADDMVRDVEHSRPGYLSDRARMAARSRVAAAINARAKGGR